MTNGIIIEILEKWLPTVTSLLATSIAGVGVWKNNQTQKNIAKQQIDANLKAKARIEWINDVRNYSSGIISGLGEMVNENEVSYIKKWYDISRKSELLKLYFCSINKNNEEQRIVVKRIRGESRNQLCVSSDTRNILYNRESNDLKNEYIKLYLDKILEFYRNNHYYKIAENYQRLLFDERAILFEMDIQDWVHDVKNKKKLEDLRKYNNHFQELVNDFQEIISLYLKIEWDKAKEGK